MRGFELAIPHLWVRRFGAWLSLLYTGCPENRDEYFGTWFGTPKEGKKVI